MTLVRYQIEEEGAFGFKVMGEVHTPSRELILQAHPSVAGQPDPQDHFLGLKATCGQTGGILPVIPISPGEWRVDQAAGTVRFSYSVQLPPVLGDFSSYLKGWREGDHAFFLGLTLFLAVADPNARYRLSFRRNPYSSCPEEDGEFFCGSRRQLFLGAFAQGPYKRTEVRCQSHLLILLREERAPARWDGLLSTISLMLPHLLALFGQAPFRRLTFFLFAHPAAGRKEMGSGLAIPEGILLTFPGQSSPGEDPRHLWLVLHECLHQWLGMDLRPEEPGLAWFFEGFTAFFTLALLKRGGFADEAYVKTLVDINRQAYLTAAQKLVAAPGSVPDYATESDYLFHGGFFLAWLLDQDWRKSQDLDLSAWMKAFYKENQGRGLNAATLLKALQAAAPGGRLPDYLPGFLRREKLLPI